MPVNRVGKVRKTAFQSHKQHIIILLIKATDPAKQRVEEGSPLGYIFLDKNIFYKKFASQLKIDSVSVRQNIIDLKLLA